MLLLLPLPLLLLELIQHYRIAQKTPYTISRAVLSVTEKPNTHSID
jgi:hypothetical protein